MMPATLSFIRLRLLLQIKKNTAPHELKPSDILIDRFTAWKQIVKMLICEKSRILKNRIR